MHSELSNRMIQWLIHKIPSFFLFYLFIFFFPAPQNLYKNNVTKNKQLWITSLEKQKQYLGWVDDTLSAQNCSDGSVTEGT